MMKAAESWHRDNFGSDRRAFCPFSEPGPDRSRGTDGTFPPHFRAARHRLFAPRINEWTPRSPVDARYTFTVSRALLESSWKPKCP